MQEPDRVVEAILMRAPFDIAFPFAAGCVRAIQGPIALQEDSLERTPPSKVQMISLMMHAFEQTSNYANEIPTLESTLIATPKGAEHLTYVETPACLGLASALSRIAPRLTLIEIFSHMNSQTHERHLMSIWQGGQVIRRLGASKESMTGDEVINEGEPQAWEPELDLSAELPIDAVNRGVIFDVLSGLGVDMAEMIGRRKFARSRILTPIIAQPPEAMLKIYDGHQRQTKAAFALGIGKVMDANLLEEDRQTEAEFRQQLLDIVTPFQSAVGKMDDISAILKDAEAVAAQLRPLGRRAEPKIMQVFESALARVLQLDPEHACLPALRTKFEIAAKAAWEG
ncbi:MAG: hypothetical protein HUJ27_17545 [Rhodobacteraceae bacterium]|nr:hypothetical protein [Paracoccaceae bacterium]